MTLKPLTKEDAEQVRLWRNECLDTLRTPYPLTAEQQADWYENVVCNRSANARWFGVHFNDEIVGYTGIENISWENRIGEISLLIDPKMQKRGFGKKAVDLILTYAFDDLNLNCIYGECYYSNDKGLRFWKEIVIKYHGNTTDLINRKYINGKYYNSLYFSILRPK